VSRNDLRDPHVRGRFLPGADHALARTLFDCAAENRVHAKWLKRLAKAAEKSYLAIAAHQAFPRISTEHLPALFQAAAGAGDGSSIAILEEIVTAPGSEREPAI
jgi:hypothetical protein